jgi:hypothetical protein
VQVAGSRYYSPGLGRWTSRDPANEEGGGPALYAFLANGSVCSVDVLGAWKLLPLWGSVPIPPSHPDAVAWRNAFDDVKSGMPSLIGRANTWLAKANSLPDSCPWKAGVLDQLKDLHIRLVKMNQALWDTSTVLPVHIGGLFLNPDRDAYSLRNPVPWPFEYELFMRPSEFGAPSFTQNIFHELYHMSDWSGVPRETDAHRYVDNAMAVELMIWGKPDFNICKLVDDVISGRYGSSPAGTSSCCPSWGDWCYGVEP